MATQPQSATDDVKQLGLAVGIASLGYVFWIVGGMEMVERLAYYGVKAVATLYAKDPVSKGGLGVTMDEFGTLLMFWAMVQAGLPIITGGLSDRFGYKETIAVSTVVKICGYLTMAAFPTYWGFFAGAIVLAAGTAIFKPGIQGTLVNATKRENSSLAWGIFYQTVNIGGFLGPLVAGYMRKMEWRYVFLACAGIIAFNFLFLLLYKEPGKEARLAKQALRPAGADDLLGKIMEFFREILAMLRVSLAEVSRPHVWPYLLIFSGFWFMFNALFDVLPAHIDDWVDTRDIVTTLFGGGGEHSAVVSFFVIMNKDGTEILPEGMMNVNSMIIMITCFFFAWLSGLMKAIHSMVLGTLLASVAMILSGFSTLGWVSLAAICIFSVGEMMSSPKFSEYVGNFAPPDKKAMYLGFAQFPIALGWTLEGKLGMKLYGTFSSKDLFSREMLVQNGMSQADADKIPNGEAFQKLVDSLHLPAHDVTAMLLQHHNPGVIWWVMAGIGVLSALGIAWYGRWVKSLGTIT